MSGEKNLIKLLQGMTPVKNEGLYVVCTIESIDNLALSDLLFHFKEKESITVVLTKEKADDLNLEYSFIASWITLLIHSSLDAVGLTASFATALAEHEISCNVVAGYYHDHIFVDHQDSVKAISVLKDLSSKP